MSTIKVNNIQHPSADEPAIVLDAAGGVAVAGMGLVHVNTTTFSAVSSVSLNNVFSATYDNYRIIVTHTAQNSDRSLQMRMRSSGSDNTTATYNYQVFNASGASVSASRATAASFFNCGVTDSADPVGLLVGDILSPFLTYRSSIVTQAMSPFSGSYMRNAVGYFDSTTSFDGFTLFPDAGNITGTIRVYGYNNG